MGPSPQEGAPTGRFRWSSASRAGHDGASQDRHLVEAIVVGEERFMVAVVADGAGGTGGGERAAELAATIALERCRRAMPRDVGDLCVLLGEVDAVVAADAEAGLAALALVVVGERQLLAASVDDAEVWIESDTGWHVLDGKRRYGSGLSIGTSTALYDVVSLSCEAVGRVILWSDGAWTAHQLPALEARLRAGDVRAEDLLPNAAVTDDDATVVLGTCVSSR